MARRKPVADAEPDVDRTPRPRVADRAPRPRDPERSGEIQRAITRALEEVPYDPPVSLAYCAAVVAHLRELVPGVVAECYWRTMTGDPSRDELLVTGSLPGANAWYTITSPLV